MLDDRRWTEIERAIPYDFSTFRLCAPGRNVPTDNSIAPCHRAATRAKSELNAEKTLSNRWQRKTFGTVENRNRFCAHASLALFSLWLVALAGWFVCLCGERICAIIRVESEAATHTKCYLFPTFCAFERARTPLVQSSSRWPVRWRAKSASAGPHHGSRTGWTHRWTRRAKWNYF